MMQLENMLGSRFRSEGPKQECWLDASDIIVSGATHGKNFYYKAVVHLKLL